MNKTAQMSPAALPSVREWRFHLGGHKTATTHIQYRLEAMRPVLMERGLDVLLPESGVRPLVLNRIAESPPKLWQLRRRKTEQLTTPLETLRRGGERVLVSEELLLGRMVSLADGRFYDKSYYLAGLLEALSKTAPVHLFLSTRALDGFLPSAYAQILRHRAPPAGGFDALAQAARSQPMRWSNVVQMLRKHAPSARLQVWPYEAYKDNADQVLGALCGLTDMPPLPDVPPPARTQAGAAPAVAAAEAITDTTLSLKDRKTKVSAIYADPAFAGPRYDPISPDNRAIFQDLYRADWDWIRQHAPETILPLPRSGPAS